MAAQQGCILRVEFIKTWRKISSQVSYFFISRVRDKKEHKYGSYFLIHTKTQKSGRLKSRNCQNWDSVLAVKYKYVGSERLNKSV